MILNNFNDIRQYFSQNTTPYYFISPTNFNLIDMHNWVNNWLNINFIDCFDSTAPDVDVSTKASTQLFESLEEINQYLLTHENTQKLMADKSELLLGAENSHGESQQAQAIFLFFNKEIEAICKAQHIEIQLPDNALVKSIDNKITTTEIGNQAGVYSVPNVLAKVESFEALMALAKEHHLSEKLVVQTAFGDSGKTTFFINNQADYDKVASQIECEDKVKVMKCIRCVGSAIEACATKQGTYVGPLLSEMIGFEELTPYKGGWCGNELYQSAFSTVIRADVHEKTELIGNELYQRGYRGYFEVDYLLDLDDGNVYLGELNPRITGISAMTNMSPFCQQTIPLFLFHLLEYSDAQLALSPKVYNQESLLQGAQSTSSQMIIKHTTHELQKIHGAPVSGVYRLVNGELVLEHVSSNPVDKGDDSELAYVLRIMDKDEYAYYGGDLAIIFLNSKLTQNQGTELNNNATSWINAVNNAYDIRSLTAEESELLTRFTSPNTIKGDIKSEGSSLEEIERVSEQQGNNHE